MKTLRTILITIVFILVSMLFYYAIFPNKSPAWTGFGSYVEKQDEHRAKTLWDWLDLLIIPVVVGFTAWIFKEVEKEKTARMEQEKAYENILDSFVNVMTKLLLENGLGSSTQTEQTVAVARTRIILALNNLNGARKGQVLQFLYESKLISISPKINILGVDLKNAIINGIVLTESEIRGAYFNGALMKKANLSKAIFVGCDFTDADLSGCLVDMCDFSYANLTNATLRNLVLSNVNLEGANLTGADLRGSTIKQSQLDQIKEKDNLKITKNKIV